MVARPQRDRVRTVPAEHPLGARARGDRVVVASLRDEQRPCRRRQRLRADLRKVVALHIHLHKPVVTQNRVRARARHDRVRPHPAQDRVVAVPDLYGVVATSRRYGVRGLVAQNLAGAGEPRRHVINPSVITKNDVVRRRPDLHPGQRIDPRVDGVPPVSTDNPLCPATRVDRVVGAQRQLRARYRREVQAGRIHLDNAVVAQDCVDAVARRDRIRPHPAQDRVVAVTRRDCVVTASHSHRVRRLVAQRLSRSRQTDANIGHRPVVAQHGVVTRAQVDRVHAVAPQDEFVAREP